MILCKHEWSVSFVLQVSALDRSSKDAVLKFEPFVLHVQCRKLEDAQLVVRNRFIGFYLMNAQGVNTTKIIFLIKKKNFCLTVFISLSSSIQWPSTPALETLV